MKSILTISWKSPTFNSWTICILHFSNFKPSRRILCTLAFEICTAEEIYVTEPLELCVPTFRTLCIVSYVRILRGLPVGFFFFKTLPVASQFLHSELDCMFRWDRTISFDIKIFPSSSGRTITIFIKRFNSYCSLRFIPSIHVSDVVLLNRWRQTLFLQMAVKNCWQYRKENFSHQIEKARLFETLYLTYTEC